METDFDALYEFHAVAQTMDDEFCRSHELQRLYTRRRSISLTSDVDPEMLSALVARVRSKREGVKPNHDDEEQADDAVRRRNPPKRNTSDPKRPSSMLVHDNDELLQLADELHLRDIHGAESKERRQAVVAGRRSSSSAGYLLYHGVTANQPMEPDQNFASKKSRTLSQKDLEALRRVSVCSGQMTPADGVPLKLSPTSTSNSKSSKLSSLGHLFGTGGKRGTGAGSNPPVVNVGGVQSKIAKKMERQLSKEGGPPSDQRRAQFLQARSNTGLNFFGSRRRSIAITDDAYNVALRSAKSHLDLSEPPIDEPQKTELDRHHTAVEAVKKNGESLFKNNIERKLLLTNSKKSQIASVQAKKRIDSSLFYFSPKSSIDV
jgi:hypothetical protein